MNQYLIRNYPKIASLMQNLNTLKKEIKAVEFHINMLSELEKEEGFEYSDSFYEGGLSYHEDWHSLKSDIVSIQSEIIDESLKLLGLSDKKNVIWVKVAKISQLNFRGNYIHTLTQISHPFDDHGSGLPSKAIAKFKISLEKLVPENEIFPLNLDDFLIKTAPRNTTYKYKGNRQLVYEDELWLWIKNE